MSKTYETGEHYDPDQHLSRALEEMDPQRGISNDQTASKTGRARAKLQEMLPQGTKFYAIPANRHRAKPNGYSIFEYFFIATDPMTGRPILLNRYLRAIGFGVNRTRGTIRSQQEIYSLAQLIAIRVHGHPDALNCIELDTTV